MTTWTIKTVTDDPQSVQEMVEDQRNRGYSAWIEDENGRSFDEEGFKKSGRPPTPFDCSNCGAKYKLVRVEAPAGPTTDREITCISCGGPLHGREGKFLLKYFLIERPRPPRPSPRTAS